MQADVESVGDAYQRGYDEAVREVKEDEREFSLASPEKRAAIAAYKQGYIAGSMAALLSAESNRNN